MAAYTLYLLSCYQMNILFLLFIPDLEDSIVYFLLHSHIHLLSHIHFKMLHMTAQVVYCPFLHYLQVLPHWIRREVVRVSDSVFPMQYSFNQILNKIPCVNIFPSISSYT